MRPAWYSAFVRRHPELRIQTFALTPPAFRVPQLDAVTERLSPDDERWWGEARRQAFLDSLSEINVQRLEELRLQTASPGALPIGAPDRVGRCGRSAATRSPGASGPRAEAPQSKPWSKPARGS